MPPVAAMVVNLADKENVRIAETLARAMTLLVAVGDEALRVVANTVSRILGDTGQVAFVAQADHATVTSYTARVRVLGNSTVVATQALGTPTPDANSVIIVNIAATFAGLAAGSYTVSILATSPGGSTDSAESSAFTLPLP
jgi:hypothetical protein